VDVDQADPTDVDFDLKVPLDAPPTEPKAPQQRRPARAIKCPSCPEFIFSGPAKLIQHAKDVHNDSQPFKCLHAGCVKAYGNPKALKIHKRSHEEVQRFRCEECQAGFHVKVSLLAHMRTHTNEKSFKCSFIGCDK